MVRSLRSRLNVGPHFDAPSNLAEGDVLAIQLRVSFQRDEELGTVGIAALVRHAQDTRLTERSQSTAQVCGGDSGDPTKSTRYDRMMNIITIIPDLASKICRHAVVTEWSLPKPRRFLRLDFLRSGGAWFTPHLSPY